MTRLMSFCTQPMVAANSAVVAPMKVTKASASGAYSRIGDMRAIRNTPAVTMVAAWISAETGRRAFHRVRQPDVQADLRRLAHRADEQQDADHLVGARCVPNNVNVSVLVLGDAAEDGGELDRAEGPECQRDAEREAEVADAVDDERLDRGGAGGRAVIPVADEQVAHQPDAFPAEEQLHQVVGRHQHQHGEGEQAEIAEEAPAWSSRGSCSRRCRCGSASRRR